MVSDSRGVVHWLVGTGMVASATWLLVMAGANSATAGILFLVLVVWSSTQAGLALSLYMALLCGVSFDYFFLIPYHTLMLAGAQQWVDMLSFTASCVVVSRVAERARRQTRQAEQRREDVERLYELSQEMMLHEDASSLIRDLPRVIHRIFELGGVVLYVCDQDQFHASTDNVPASLRGGMLSITQGNAPTISTDSNYYLAPLMLGLRSVGALAWTPDELSREVATAVSAQVAIVLARSIAIEASSRIEAAREAERLRTALIDSLTHELRTPLTSIRAAATTLLEAEGLDEEGRKDLVMIVDEEASRLDTLIGEAVEMAEIDANVVRVHVTRQHSRALLEQAVEESRKALVSHRVVIKAEETDEPVWFDAHLLGRVLRHLLENAGAHTPVGTRVVLSSGRAGGRLEFVVEDDGPGVEPVDLPKIFEKFYRGKRSVARSKGSGMGLAITRSILTTHGGGIEVTSAPGKGTSFRFWVPLVEGEPGS